MASEEDIIEEVQKLRAENISLKMQLGITEVELDKDDRRCILGHIYDLTIGTGRCWCGHVASGHLVGI